MDGLSEDKDRQVVPRWRSSGASIQRGEHSHSVPSEPKAEDPEAVEGLVDGWNRSRTLSVAADLVSCAFTLGLDDVAADAAEFVLANPVAPLPSRSIAALYLKRPDPAFFPREPDGPADEAAVVGLPTCREARKFQLEIRRTRAELVRFPRNPLLWNDLALLYATVGSRDKAWRAMQAALTLARQNRLILRGASRLLLHQGKLDEAHALLASSPMITVDPWILSAEIATAAAARKTSRRIKYAERVLDMGRYSPFHLSELASALGTLEAVNGKTRHGRRLVERSLAEPTENAVAQAAWLVRKTGISVNTQPVLSSEAQAWSSSRVGAWDSALVAATQWQDDQPFSSRPAVFGSHLAGVVGDHERAVRFASQGILGNRGDYTLINNLAFSLINLGRTSEANALLGRLAEAKRTALERVLWDATTGFLHFRSGEPDVGRLYYRNAILLADQNRLEKPAAVARLYLAMEEIRIYSPLAAATREEAIDRASRVTEPWVSLLLERIG